MGDKAKECFGEIELTLPNGRQCVGKVPTLKQQIEVMNLVNRVAQGHSKSQLRLVEWFPKLVGLDEELNQLTFEEFFDVVNRFFGRRGSGNGRAKQTATAEASSDCLQSTPDTTNESPIQGCTGPCS